MGFKIPNFYKQTFQAPNSKGPAPSTHSKQSPLNELIRGGGSSEKPEGPDWSKAPKNNTQARRDWYTKNNLKQDETTKLKTNKPVETKPVESKSEETKNEEPKTDVDPVKPKGKKRAKRAARIEKRKQKKEGIQAVKDSGLKGKEKREAKRAVREKVGKTKVGKALKSAKDKVVKKDSKEQK